MTRVQVGSALTRLALSLRRGWVRHLGRGNNSGTNASQNQNQNHSPLRQLEHRGGEERGSREDEDDVELLIPVSDTDSASSFSSLASESCRPLLEARPSSTTGRARRHHHSNGCRGGRDGPCEHCGMVHTAQIPDACLEATGKTESSDDELLLLC